MDNREVKSIIEALLFTWGDPLETKDLASILSNSEENIVKLMEEMIYEFENNRRGIRIIKVKNSYQFSTRAEHFDWIKKLSNPKLSKNLSNAALETLSIIAYRQPIIKADIESIRGVRCDRAIETLLERGLIEELGRLERIGRPILYGTTEVFLRSFGLESLDKLPALEEIEVLEEEINKLEIEE